MIHQTTNILIIVRSSLPLFFHSLLIAASRFSSFIFFFSLSLSLSPSWGWYTIKWDNHLFDHSIKSAGQQKWSLLRVLFAAATACEKERNTRGFFRLSHGVSTRKKTKSCKSFLLKLRDGRNIRAKREAPAGHTLRAVRRVIICTRGRDV